MTNEELIAELQRHDPKGRVKILVEGPFRPRTQGSDELLFEPDRVIRDSGDHRPITIQCVEL